MNITARWIAPQGVRREKNCHFKAMTHWNLKELPQRLELFIAAESYYMLEINDVEICRGPARGTEFVNFADCVDVSHYLHIGENFVQIRVYCMNITTSCASPAEPALWVQGGTDGEYLVSDASWPCALCNAEYPSDVPMYSYMAGFAEWRDCRGAGRDTPVPTVELPQNSKVYEKKLLLRETPLPVETVTLPVDIPAAAFVPEADLADQQIAHLSTYETHLPLPEGTAAALTDLLGGGEHSVTLPVPPENGGITMVFDFGKEVSGRFEAELTAPDGAVVDLGYEEELFQQDRLRADHGHTNPSYQFSDRTFLAAGRNRIGNRFQDRGFRMVQMTIRNVKTPVIVHQVRAVDRRYPFSSRAEFFSSDYRLNRLWECSHETLSACITDIFTDCPWRERLFYTNDLVVQNRTALEMFADGRLHRHAFRMIFPYAEKNGLVPSFIPGYELTSVGGMNLGVILSANLTLPLIVLDYYMRTGDEECVRNCYPALEKVLDTFRARLDDKLLIEPPNAWNFFDWSYEMNGSAFSNTRTSLLNYFYVIALQAMRAMAQAAGHCYPGAEAAEAVCKATTKAFYRPAIRRIADAEKNEISPELLARLGVPAGAKRDSESSRLPHALAILAGAGNGPGNVFLEGLKDEKLLSPDLFYWYFLLQALTLAGDDKTAWESIEKYWMPMLDSGTPTLWEAAVHVAGKAAFGGSASLCHGFSTAPVDFIQRRILGIEPLKPGFAEFRFDPYPGTLEFAQGRVPTPAGAIRVKYRRKDQTLLATLEVPEGLAAHTAQGILTGGRHEFELPVSSCKKAL